METVAAAYRRMPVDERPFVADYPSEAASTAAASSSPPTVADSSEK
jgi:hypothetical protein